MKEKCLWFRQPASEWEEALPLGNGRLGAMVYGGIKTETIKLNEETLWSGYPRDKDLVDAKKHLMEVRQLIDDNELLKAQDYLERTMLGEWNESYLPMADLKLVLETDGEITDYVRELDIEKAIAKTEFVQDGRCYKREVLISVKEDVLYCHFEVDKGALEVSASLSSPLKHTVDFDGEKLLLKGSAPSHVEPNYVDSDNPIIYDDVGGMGFQNSLEVIIQEGNVVYNNGVMKVNAKKSITFLLKGVTGYRGYDSLPERNPIIESQCQYSYENVKKEHIFLWRERFNKVFFEIEDKQGRASEKPTDVRLNDIQDENYHDHGLVSLLFNYGRYLLMSSSQPGGEPANLQGIWNERIRAPWSSNWTVNINTQMNYWLAEVCGMAEFHDPLFKLIGDLSIRGKKTAEVQYGTRGWVSHHNIDLWRQTSQVGKYEKNIRPAQYAFWPMSGVWLCQHLWEHYDFGKDKVFLKEKAYPVLEGAVEFVLDWLVEGSNGLLMTMPSTSPENSFFFKGVECSVSKSSTMDCALIRELLDRFITSSRILGITNDLLIKSEQVIGRVPNYKISKDNSLQEWFDDYDESDVEHRHMSHLVGLYPGSDMFRQPKSEENFDACRVSLKKKGEDSVGWSLAWKVALYARLLEGNSAYRLIRKQLKLVDEKAVGFHKGGSYVNLFAAHPPFQIDANFGVTAGIAEMLLQSHNECVHIIPGIPEVWRAGNFKGLRARGGFILSASWENSSLCDVVVHSSVGEALVIKSPNPITSTCGCVSSTYENGIYVLKMDTEVNKTYHFIGAEREEEF